MSGQVDHYKVLGLDPSAEDFLITAAYRALVKKYHPDVYPHEDGAVRIRQINAAYEVLGEPVRRASYDRGLGDGQDSSMGGQPMGILDFIDLQGNVTITPALEIKIPANCVIDKYVVYFLNLPQNCARNFSERWQTLPDLNAAGFEGFRIIERAVRVAVDDLAYRCSELLLDIGIAERGRDIIDELFNVTDPVFSQIRYAAISAERGEQRRMLRTTGEELAQIVMKVCEILTRTVLDQMAREGVPVDSAASIEARRQNARGMIAQGVPTVDQAMRSLQTSIFDNAPALSVVFGHLLAADGWESRIEAFFSFVLAAGPFNFFEQGKELRLGPGDICLVEKIRNLLTGRDVAEVLVGVQAIAHSMAHIWPERGQILLDHCFVTFTNECLDGERDARRALRLFESMNQIEAAFFPGRLQGYLILQQDKASDWLVPRAMAAVQAGNAEDIGVAGRIAKLLLPTTHQAKLATAAQNGFSRLLQAGARVRPDETIKAVSQQFDVDADRLWRTATGDYFAAGLIAGRFDDRSSFEAAAAPLLGGLPDDRIRRELFERVRSTLVVGDREAPSVILVKAVDVFGATERWATGAVPTAALQTLRALFLQGIGDLPGELMPSTAPKVREIVGRLRGEGRYFSVGGIIAVVPGENGQVPCVLTPNGIYRPGGAFHPYLAIAKAEPVQGWTQHYVKYQLADGQVFELNKLGSMAVANFVTMVIGNGMKLADEVGVDEVLRLFAGRDTASELYLDRWAGAGQLVLVTDEHKLLPASLARGKLLAALGSSGENAVPSSAPTDSTVAVAAAPHPGAADGVPATSDVETVILDLCSRHAGKGFGFGRSIDARKLLSARKTFPMPLDLKVYGLIDATLLGTNEKGLAITANGIYWKNGWTQETAKSHLTWHEFKDIQIEQRFDKFGLGPGNFYETSGSSYPNGLLNQLLHALQASVRLIDVTADGAGLSAEVARPPDGATIETIIEWACNTHSGGGIPLGGSIKPKKLTNARNEFPLPAGVIVVGLVDLTAFGSNKNGLAICTDGIYWKNDWTTKTMKTALSWVDLAGREIGSASRELLFGPDAVVGMSATDVKPATLAAVLGEICDAVRVVPHLAAPFLGAGR